MGRCFDRPAASALNDMEKERQLHSQDADDAMHSQPRTHIHAHMRKRNGNGLADRERERGKGQSRKEGTRDG